MDAIALIAGLFLVTSLSVIVFALVSKNRTETRMRDDSAPKSTLASDAPHQTERS
ncbi:hypothetical protein [Primorskyibacter sp. S187A]|uniref:hypothetical protein n=1 Tax=Primorskyibacter sp. S187A TaxID=3415130 RepID=UPI003C7EBE49